MIALVVLLLFFLSGAAALMFEAVFLRQLGLLLGNTATATAVVLAAFMAGLAIGAARFGAAADRSARPLRLFAFLELAAGVSGLAAAALLGPGRDLVLAALRRAHAAGWETLPAFFVAFVLVVPPAVFMGGSLPALCRWLAVRPSQVVGSVGLLYGVNTLGAAAGIFVAGFYLFESLGVFRTAVLAGALDGAVGLAALGLARLGAAEAAPAPGAPSARAAAPASAARIRAACLLAAGAGGAAVLGYEVIWTRLLTLPLRSFSYSFCLMLTLFLIGLVLGSLAIAAVGRRIRDPVGVLGWIQVAIGAYVAVSLYAMPGSLAPVGAGSFESFLFRASLDVAWIVLPPTILSGMSLPLAVRGLAETFPHVGRSVGGVYAVNTVGAIVGSLAAGLLLLPALGAPGSLGLLAVLHATAGVVVLALPGRAPARWGLAAIATCAILVPVLSSKDAFVRAFLDATRTEAPVVDLLMFHEGTTDTVAVVTRDYGFFDPGAKSLVTNGFAMTATVLPVRRYMALEGHLPVFLAKNPRRVLAIGIGTGITLGAMVSHDLPGEIVAVELSEGVLRALDLFEAENGGAHRDPRVRIVRDDGRRFLERTAGFFDAITLEPPPPIVAGSVHLYSFDFYRDCRERLAPGGVVAQWLPLHAQSLRSARMTARTFLEAFPHVQLWWPSARDAILVGSMAPIELDLGRLEAAYAAGPTREALVRAYLETPEALLATFLADRAAVARFAGEVPVITDDRPWMEFFRNQGRTMRIPEAAPLLAEPQGSWTFVAGLADHPGFRGRVERENRALRNYLASAVESDPGKNLLAIEESSGTEFYLHRIGCAVEQVARLESSAAAAGHLERCRKIRTPRRAP